MINRGIHWALFFVSSLSLAPVQAQYQPNFLELQRKQVLRFDPAAKVWEPVDPSSTQPIEIIGQELLIDEKLNTLGRSVVLATHRIRMVEGGGIHTQNHHLAAPAVATLCIPQQAGSKGTSGMRGASATRSGNITIYASFIDQQLILNASGARGGNGGPGCQGGPGQDTFVPSEDGQWGVCNPQTGTATTGAAGVRPSSDSIASGDGGDGGEGGRGGDAGLVTIFFNRNTSPKVQPQAGGAPGEPGESGHLGTAGAPGPSGDGGGSGECTKRVRIGRGEYEDRVYATRYRGAAGPRGYSIYGRLGQRPPGNRGDASEVQYIELSREAIAQKLKEFGL